MKKYRISYDKYFTCKNDYIKYKNEEIDGIAIYFEYHIKDKKTGKEIFFTCEDEPYEQRFIDHSCNSFYRCDYDKNSDTGFTMTALSYKDLKNYEITYTVDSCFKWLGWSNPVSISYEEFIDILKNNSDAFDYSNNKPAQSTAYSCCVIES